MSLERAAKIYREQKAKLREWVILNKSYGGAGAINGPVHKDHERAIQHHMIRRARELARWQ